MTSRAKITMSFKNKYLVFKESFQTQKHCLKICLKKIFRWGISLQQWSIYFVYIICKRRIAYWLSSRILYQGFDIVKNIICLNLELTINIIKQPHHTFQFVFPISKAVLRLQYQCKMIFFISTHHANKRIKWYTISWAVLYEQ